MNVVGNAVVHVVFTMERMAWRNTHVATERAATVADD
jgi:hypothetical protein